MMPGKSAELDDDEKPRRPTIAAEFRAWIAVAVTLMINVIVVVYWAATLSENIKTLQTNVAELKSTVADRYTGAQAQKDFTEVYGRIADHENRIRALERR
jgi:hypothetical protein